MAKSQSPKKSVIKGTLSGGSKVLSKKPKKVAEAVKSPTPQTPSQNPSPKAPAGVSGGGKGVVGGGGNKLPVKAGNTLPVKKAQKPSRQMKDVKGEVVEPAKKALPSPGGEKKAVSRLGSVLKKGGRLGGVGLAVATVAEYSKEIGRGIGDLYVRATGADKGKVQLQDSVKARAEGRGGKVQRTPAPAKTPAKAAPSASGSFGEAYRAARKSGPGTRFKWRGKDYAAVSKEDVSSGKFKKTKRGYVKNG